MSFCDIKCVNIVREHRNNNINSEFCEFNLNDIILSLHVETACYKFQTAIVRSFRESH